MSHRSGKEQPSRPSQRAAALFQRDFSSPSDQLGWLNYAFKFLKRGYENVVGSEIQAELDLTRDIHSKLHFPECGHRKVISLRDSNLCNMVDGKDLPQML